MFLDTVVPQAGVKQSTCGHCVKGKENGSQKHFVRANILTTLEFLEAPSFLLLFLLSASESSSINRATKPHVRVPGII